MKRLFRSLSLSLCVALCAGAMTVFSGCTDSLTGFDQPGNLEHNTTGNLEHNTTGNLEHNTTGNLEHNTTGNLEHN